MSARAKNPTSKMPPAPRKSAAESDPGDNQKTTIYDSGPHVKQAPIPAQPSGPIQMISMKTPAEPSGQHMVAHRVHQVKMRAISEVSALKQAQPQNLGNLAPPRDPTEVRTRHFQDYVIWGCLSVIIASGIALAVWFLARR